VGGLQFAEFRAWRTFGASGMALAGGIVAADHRVQHPIEELADHPVRWQFGVTTVYHFFFVPLTLGLVWVVAGLHTAWVRHRPGQTSTSA
jgi:hypothetical protein